MMMMVMMICCVVTNNKGWMSKVAEFASKMNRTSRQTKFTGQRQEEVGPSASSYSVSQAGRPQHWYTTYMDCENIEF